MKKLMFTIMSCVLLLSFSYAHASTMLQSTPWLSNENETLQYLQESGLIMAGETLHLTKDSEARYILEDDTDFVFPGRAAGDEDIVFSEKLEDAAKGKIAGHPVQDIYLTYAYDGDYKLIAVTVSLIGAEYGEIESKLNKVYGDGEKRVTEELIESTVWRGENNTCIVLYSESEGLDYVLMYGRRDAADIVSSCLLFDHEDASGL